MIFAFLNIIRAVADKKLMISLVTKEQMRAQNAESLNQTCATAPQSSRKPAAPRLRVSTN
jgi:hypothetical protein